MPSCRIILLSVLFGFSSLSYAECQSQRVKVQVLGSGGPELTDGRASSSYLVWLNDRAPIMIDAGAGSSLNYEKSGAKLNDLEVIAFTHFHVDHSADFPALVKAFYFSEREKDLSVLGPEGNEYLPSASDFIQRLFAGNGLYPYLQDYVSLKAKSLFKLKAYEVQLAKNQIKTVFQTADYTLDAIPVHHGPLPAVAWRVRAQGCSLVFSGDMSNRYGTLSRLADKADLLVAHHAIPEMHSGKGRHLHMPPSEIGKIAKQAGINKLILSHRMQRTLGQEKQSTRIINNYYKGPISFADDLEIFDLL